MIPRARGDVVNGRDEVQVVSGQAGVRASGSGRARVNGPYEVRAAGPGLAGPERAGTGRLGGVCQGGPGEARASGCDGIRAGEGSGGHESRGDREDREGRGGRTARAVGEGL